jgi:hypothetical protein
MAFIQQGNTVYSFATYDDVVAKDRRLFSANEGLNQTVVEEALVRATQRIVSILSGSDWWKNYYIRKAGNYQNVVFGQNLSVPPVQPYLIRARRDDFTDLCVYFALSEYLYPGVADFGNPDSAERQKIGFYDEKYRELLRELYDDGDWYDFNEDGNISRADQYPSRVNLVRVR